MSPSPVKERILVYAQSLVQTRGYNAMSYRDLATEIGIKTSSIHYYFPSKEDLAVALIDRYRKAFKSALKDVDAKNDDPGVKFERFVDLFIGTVRSGKICLCGMFASDLSTLSETVQQPVRAFFSESEAWLAQLLKSGRDGGKFSFSGSPQTKAQVIFSMLEGAMITARLFNDEKRLLTASQWVRSTLAE